MMMLRKHEKKKRSLELAVTSDLLLPEMNLMVY